MNGRVFRLRRGFTLLELMISSVIAIVVLTAVVSTFITSQRMLRTAMCEAELSLAMRALREKLLFRVSPTIDDKVYSGLAGATAVDNGGRPTRTTFENQVQQGYVELYAPAVKGTLSQMTQESMRIRDYAVGADRIVINEHTPDRDRHLNWLWPGHLPLATTRFTDVVDFAAVNRGNANNPMIYRLYLDLALKAGVKTSGGADIVRRERVSIPLLGRIQQMQDYNSNNQLTY